MHDGLQRITSQYHKSFILPFLMFCRRHIVKRDLREEAVNKHIESENFSEFHERVLGALKRIPCDIIDKTIASLSKCVDAVIESGGYRTKY
jgi:2-oxo-4-hydroxy-4-carboxy--5-ureidoimidazoline (OHCU) decarboxylase